MAPGVRMWYHGEGFPGEGKWHQGLECGTRRGGGVHR